MWDEHIFPTEGKYTQDGGARGPEQGNSQRNPPFYSAYDAEFCAADTPEAEYLPPRPVNADDLPYAEVAHELGFTPPPAASETSTAALPFDFNGNVVRAIVGQDGEAWFVARDICAVLGIENPSVAIQSLDDDERAKLNLGRQGEAWIVSEAGVYTLVVRSRKEVAKPFRRWLTHEVIPSIRKHGGYLTPQATEEALNDPDFIIGLANKLKEERAKTAALRAENARIATEKLRIAQENAALAIAKQKLAQANAVMEPKVVLHDALMEADGAVTMDEAAKTLQKDFPGMGRTSLFALLRRKGILMYNNKKYNVPTQVYMNKDYLRVVQKTVNYNGYDQVYPQTYVKPAGMAFLYNFLKYHYRRNPKALVA